jgi:hypothetical protein
MVQSPAPPSTSPSAISGTAVEALQRAQATLATGRLGDARAQFFDAAQHAAREGLFETRAEAAIGAGGLWLHELRITDERAAFLGLVRDTLVDLGSARPDLQRRLLVRLAAEAAYDGSGSLVEVTKLVDEARDAGDAVALGEGLSLLHHAMLTPRHAHERLDVADELVRVATAIGAPTLALMGMCWRTIDLLWLGRSDAERALAELRLRADQYDVLAVRYVVSAIDTMRYVRAGRFDDAEALALASHALGADTGDADADAAYLAQLLASRWMQGRAGELLDEVEEIENATTIVHAYAEYVWPVVAVLGAAAGQRELTRAALDRVLAAGLHSLPESSAWLPAMFCVAEAAAYLGDVDAAYEVIELLEPYASLPIVGSLAVVCFGSVARSVALARRTIGDLDGAVCALEDAIKQNRQVGHLPMVAIARADLARTLVERDRPGDRTHAKRLYEVAIEAGLAMEMDARVELWRAEADAIGVAPADAGSVVRAGAHWEVAYRDERAIVPHSVGMGYLVTLLSRPRDDVRAALLAGAVEEQGHQPVLDARAREAYRREVVELRREIDEADGDGDIERAARLRAELDALVEQLTHLVRPGGRSRAFTDADERARTSVQKALRRAIEAIRRGAPRLGEGLMQSIRTGTVCRFEPVDLPERWLVRFDSRSPAHSS